MQNNNVPVHIELFSFLREKKNDSMTFKQLIFCNDLLSGVTVYLAMVSMVGLPLGGGQPVQGAR